MKTLHAQEQYDQHARVGLLINEFQTRLETSLDTALARFGVSAAQYVVISAIANGRADTAAQLCKEISYSPGAMTRMLNRLEAKKLICRTTHNRNPRASRLTLTTASQDIYPELKAISGATIAQMFAPLSNDELKSIETILRKASS